MSSDVIRVSPERIRYKLEDVSDLEAPVWPGDWDVTRRIPLDQTAKHRSIVAHFRDGVPWRETPLFREVYPVRFARGELVHGCRTLEELVAQYDVRQGALYEDLKARGFRALALPDVYLARDGEVILSNDGNHRVAMAKLIGLPWVLAKVRTRHPLAPVPEPAVLEPNLPSEAEGIPAMTTTAERLRVYEIARAQAPHGVVVELGAWLGAMTVYLAAGVRDAGTSRVHTFDRFVWKPVHTTKAGPLTRPMLDQFRLNLGPLADYVEIHVGDFRDATWSGGPIGFLSLDGPKRAKEITRTLPIFGPSLRPGSRMAWQDFGHFSCYDLPACLDTLERAGVVRWEEGVYPGTMSVFEVLRPITAEDVSADRLRLDRWTPDTIEWTWARWTERLPAGQRPRFQCSAVVFLCDLGHVDLGTARFRAVLQSPGAQDVVRKWEMLRATNPEFVRRYPTLDAAVSA